MTTIETTTEYKLPSMVEVVPEPAIAEVSAEVQTQVATMQARLPIAADEGGVFRPKSIDEAFRLATAYYKSKLLPKHYTSPEMVMTAMQFAIELGLKPLTALRQIAVVNGSPCIWGDLPLALCYQTGKLQRFREYLVDKNLVEIKLANGNLSSEAFGAICVVHRGLNDQDPAEIFYTLDDARKANLLNSPTWKNYPKDMLKYRARSRALKSKFADALNGVPIAEYDYNMIPTEGAAGVYEVDRRGQTGEASELARRLHGEATT